MKLSICFSSIILYAVFQHGNALVKPLDPHCQQALGLENNEVLDANIRTGENAVQSGRVGHFARLNNDNAWCIPISQYPMEEAVFTKNIFLEIDLRQPTQINAIALQGYRKYSYGKEIRIKYLDDKDFINYIQNGMKDIPVQSLKYDNYEILRLEHPIKSTKIQIFLQYGQNTKCLRAELYGCRYGKPQIEYKDCPTKNVTILQEDLVAQRAISQSNYLRMGENYNGEKLLFSQLYAWCLKEEQIPTINLYKDWALIDMKKNYLVHGLIVDGFHTSIVERNAKYLTKSFKFEYSLDNQKWASYEGGKAITTLDKREEIFEFPNTLVARYVKVFMFVNSTQMNCLKIQLYGCSAMEGNKEITTTPQTWNTLKPTTKLVRAEIKHYKIYQGNNYSPQISWKDTKYRTRSDHKGILSNNAGCLTDKMHRVGRDPFKKSSCWVGWNKRNVSKPFIEMDISPVSTFTGLIIRTYVNETMNASPIKKITVEYSSVGIGVVNMLGRVCTPDAIYHLSPRSYDIFINLHGVRAERLIVRFEYSGKWILVRQITLTQDPINEDEYLSLTKSSVICKVPAKVGGGKPKADVNTIITIICVVFGLCLIFLVSFLVYHYRTSLHKVFKSSAGQPIIVRTTYEKGTEKTLVHTNQSYDKLSRKGSQQLYLKRYNSRTSDTDQVYAAPEMMSIASDQSLLLPKSPQYQPYDVMSHVSTHRDFTDGFAHSEPNGEEEHYAEPNSPPPAPYPSYTGSVIYAESFKSPYQAVVASSMYTDPNKVIGKTILRDFPREQLVFKERIGVGQFGEVHIAEATGLEEIYHDIGHYSSWGASDSSLVAVKVLKSEDVMVTNEFMKEIKVVAHLKHENVVRLLGVCRDKPMIMVCEYMENGDLNQFLRTRRPCDESNIRASMIPADALLNDSLLHIAQQIAAGMKYLHAEGFIHRDLATRNCLVGPAYQVKIADFGMSRYLYSKHYYRVEGKAILPIRWMAPECMFYGKFTYCTDVWSFGVTLWEIFNFARITPYHELSDTQVIELSCEAIQHPIRQFACLNQPAYCPSDIYNLMRKCWHIEPESRPTFAFINRIFTDLGNTSEGDI